MPPATASHGGVGSPVSRHFSRETVELGFSVWLCWPTRKWVWALIFVVIAAPTTAEQEPETNDAAGLHALYYGSHLPEDRSLARQLQRAEELLSRQRFSEALPILDSLLAAEQDVLLEARGSGTQPNVSIKVRAEQLLAGLPPKGREAYLLLYEAQAKREIAGALEQHNQVALSRVASRFEHTPAGEEGALILAQMASDAGNFDAAALRVERLMELPAARQRWGDYLPLRAAELAARRGQFAATEKYLAQSSLRGEEAHDLRRTLAASPPTTEPSLADRNATAPAGTPHLWERWRARVVVDRRLESQLAERQSRSRDSLLSAPLLPSAIAVGDLVVARSLNHLVAIDWNTGKRIWETRPETDAWLDASDEHLTAYSNDPYSRSRLHPLLLRLWKDAVFASLSSDGQRIFAIRDLDYATAAMNTRFGMLPGFPDASDRQSVVANRLAAYSIAAEGKIAWEIDGTKPGHALSGAFFLGAPLAVSGSLYAIAEIESSIYLLELAPSDGRLLWKQPLVSLERGVDQDASRRLAGATASYRNGLLVCPTGAGVVIAVDPIDRALKWTFRVPVRKSLVDQQDDLLQRRAYGSFRLLNNQWLDARAITSDEYVVVTLPESPDLHCLRLESGEVAWTRPREERLYVGGLTETQVVVVGKSDVTALKLSDGSTAWTTPHPEGRSPSGRGLLCGDELCLPLDDGRLAVIALRDGKQVQLLQTHSGQPTGNLLAHRGTILSQSLAHVDRFDYRQQLEREVAERLAENSDDATALRLAGELAETAGKPAEALELFKQAHLADPADSLARERVIDALLVAVKKDFTRHRASVELLQNLAEDPLLRLEVLRLKADGLAAAGEFADSFACYLQVYEAAIERDDTWLETAQGRTRVDRWFCGGLTRLWHDGDAQTKAAIVEAAESLKPAAADTASAGSVGPLERFVRYFGGLPGQEPALLQLADLYNATGRRRDAELTWMQLMVRGDSRFAEVARARLLQPTMPLPLETLPQSGPMAAYPLANRTVERWPAVQIAAEETRKRRSRASRRSSSDEAGPAFAPVRFHSALLPELGPATYALAANGSELIAWDYDGDVIVRGNVETPSERRQTDRRSEGIGSGRMGHFAFLSYGNSTFAIDAFATNTDDNLRMWSRAGRWDGSRTVPVRNSTPRGFDPQQGKLLIVSPHGIVLHAPGEIYCVHPLTGEVQWSRMIALNEPRIFGDAQRLFLAEVDGESGKILSIADGGDIGVWQPPQAPTIASAGHHALTELKTSDGQLFQVVDLATGDVKVELEMERGTKFAPFGPGWVALLAPLGQLEMIDLEQGKREFSHQLAAEPNLLSLEVLSIGQQLYLVTRTLSDADQRLAGYAAPFGLTPATGRLYALDAATGALLWPQPAAVTGRVVLSLQPPAAPALLLASFRASPEESRGELQLELLAIDKATGQSVYRSPALDHSLSDPISVHLERRPETAIYIDSRQWEVHVQATSQPRSPEPVAHDEVESSSDRDRDGLWGVGRQLGRVLEGVLRGADE